MSVATQQQPTPTNAARPPRYTVQQAAALIGWGEKQLFRWLRNANILYIDRTSNCNLPFRMYITAGLFEVEPYSYINQTTQIMHHAARTYITSKGLDYLKRHIPQVHLA